MDIFSLECLNAEHIQRIWKVLKTFRQDFNIPLRSSEVVNKIVNDIYQSPVSTSLVSLSPDERRQTLSIVPQRKQLENTDPWWEKIDMTRKLNDQIGMEMEHKVKIRSINPVQEIDEKLVGLSSLFSDVHTCKALRFVEKQIRRSDGQHRTAVRRGFPH